MPPSRLTELTVHVARLIEPHLGSLLIVTLRNVLTEDSALLDDRGTAASGLSLFDIARLPRPTNPWPR